MKALTLHQPWASLIGNPPLKNIENRTWKPPASVLGQRIAIHAGKEFAVSARTLLPDFVLKLGYDPDRHWTSRGAIVSTAVVSGWYDSRVLRGSGEEFARAMGRDADWLSAAIVEIETNGNPWWIGPVGWLLTDVIRLREPIPCKGAQGLWTVPKDIEERLSR